MNMKKALTLIICMMLTLMLLTACADNALAGTWKLMDIQGEDMGVLGSEMIEMAEAFGGTITMQFTDKIMTLSADIFGMTQSQSASCQIHGNTLTIDSGNTFTYEIQGDTLTLMNTESRLVLTRMP